MRRVRRLRRPQATPVRTEAGLTTSDKIEDFSLFYRCRAKESAVSVDHTYRFK
jgi:hypothetical protein